MKKTKGFWYQQTETVFGEIFQQLCQNLNLIHNVQHTSRYWEILVGPWLRQFLDMAMVRILEIENGINVPEPVTNSLPPASLHEFREKSKDPRYTKELHWEISNGSMVQAPKAAQGDACSTEAVSSGHLKGTYISVSYLPRISEISLQLRIGCRPSKMKPLSRFEFEICDQMRSQIVDSNDCLLSLSKLIMSLLAKYLPQTYLEGYTNLGSTVRPWKYRRFPAIIFTSNRHLYDDVFNYWTAEATRRGAKLVIGQHGGNTGLSEFPSSSERHETQVADRYITWGWSSSDNCVPGFVFTTAGTRFKVRPNRKGLLIVTDQLWEYPRSIFLDLSHTSEYLSHLSLLIESLSDSIRFQTQIRIHHSDLEDSNFQYHYWQNKYPELNLDKKPARFRTHLQKSRLLLVAHNGTSIPEAFSLQFPTLLTWNESYMKVRRDAEPVFELMERAGIFHSTPESAASFINQIWDDVDGWWNSPQVIEARFQFCNQYARTVPHPVRFLAKTLKF